MTRRIVLLDSGPLGSLTSPRSSPQNQACRTWLDGMLAQGHRVLVPAITDYEIRREMRRRGSANGVRALDALKAGLGYLPLTEAALLQAADFWAFARIAGIPTADRFALDADAILAAQAATLDPGAWGVPGAEIMIATTNVGHLTRFVAAQEWQDILP